MKLGTDKTLITIMDKSRMAGFSLIPVGLDADDQIVLGMLGDEPAARVVMFIESIHTAGPNKYQEYELFEKTATMYAGAPKSGKNIKMVSGFSVSSTKYT